jgi:hypothetical protein
VPDSFRVNGMRAPGLRGVWRCIALLTLFAWLGAFGVCTTHCAFGMTPSGAEDHSVSPCHGEQSSDSHSKSDCSGTFCLTFKSLRTAAASLTVHPPETLAFLQPVFGAPRATDLVNSAQLLRQSRPPDLLLMPEVYLGPANLPHGPPNF